MRKLIAASILAISFTASAQIEEIPITTECSSDSEVFVGMLARFEEEIMVRDIGATDGTNYTLWVNPETRTWSMLRHFDDATCIVGYGVDLEFSGEWENEPEVGF